MSITTNTAVAERVRSAFSFDVERFPLTGPDGLRTPYYGLFRSDNGNAVGRHSVTRHYQPHTTDDVLALVEAAGVAFDGVADVQTHFNDGHYVVIQPTREQRHAVFGTKDNVFPRVVIDAGYNGESFKAHLVLYRDLCDNLARLRSVGGVSVAIRHASKLRQKMDELIEQFASLESGWASITRVIDQMQNRQVRMVEFLNAVYGEPETEDGRAATMHRNRTESIFRRLVSEQTRSGREPMGREWIVSGWEAYNAVQGYTQHDAIRRGRPSSTARIISAMHDSRVALAEQVALTMAV